MTENKVSSGAIAFLFPGQGSQAVGMGKDLAEKYPIARQTFEEADEALGYTLSQLCFEGREEQLRLTEVTQPAILTASIAALRVLEDRMPRPAYVAGHSLGEYSAHVAAGTLSFADAVRTVRYRGKYMQEAVPLGVGAMAAILGMDVEKVTAVCDDAAQGEVCDPANINSPQQIVISGHTSAVERAWQAGYRLSWKSVREKSSAVSCARSIAPEDAQTLATKHPFKKRWSSWLQRRKVFREALERRPAGAQTIYKLKAKS